MIDESPVVANDPGMSNANMKSVTIVVDDIDENAPPPLQELDDGEHIVRHLVPLKDLHKKILGVYSCIRQHLSNKHPRVQRRGKNSRCSSVSLGYRTRFGTERKHTVLKPICYTSVCIVSKIRIRVIEIPL